MHYKLKKVLLHRVLLYARLTVDCKTVVFPVLGSLPILSRRFYTPPDLSFEYERSVARVCKKIRLFCSLGKQTIRPLLLSPSRMTREKTARKKRSHFSL